MATLDTLPSLPLNPQIPSYLNPMTQILFGITALSASSSPLLSLFSTTWGVYWLARFAVKKPAGEYLDVYMKACTLFSVVCRMISAAYLMEREQFQRRKGGDKDEYGKSVRDKQAGNKERGVVRYVLDVLELGFMSPRGVGWNFQIRNLASAPATTTPRVPFALSHLLNALFHLLLVDLAHHHLTTNTPIATPPYEHLTTLPFLPALLNAWLIYLQARWTMTSLYSLLAFFTVPLHIFSPASFPPLFGSFEHAYTIKRFWGLTWHQMLRTLALPYTNALVKLLGCDETRKSTYWVKVFSAFFWAWAVHAYATFVAGGGLRADFLRYAPQILGFWVEEKVVDWGLSKGLKGWKWRVLGYLWVFLFEGVTLLAWYGPSTDAGAFVKSPIPFTVVGPLMDRLF